MICFRRAPGVSLPAAAVVGVGTAVIPEKIAKYKIVGPLGQGSTGVVYQAVDDETQQKVALKVIPPEMFPSAEARDLFLADARAAATLSHPRLRQLYEVGESDGDLYLAMEHLHGSTLRSLLVGGPAEMGSALAWSAEIAEGLAAAHQAGVVHGELFPGKIFLTKEGGLKLLDAGLWRLAVPVGVDLSLESNLRIAKLTASQVAVLAPERIHGQEPDPRSDVFSLGVLIYQMVTGRQPFQENSPVDTMHCVLGRTPPPVSDFVSEVPPALDTVLARALAKEPDERYASAVELAAALRAVAAGEPLPVEQEAAVARQASKRAAWPLWLAIGAALLLLALWYFYIAVAPR
jgi:serine/threonine protein kinase